MLIEAEMNAAVTMLEVRERTATFECWPLTKAIAWITNTEMHSGTSSTALKTTIERSEAMTLEMASTKTAVSVLT